MVEKYLNSKVLLSVKCLLGLPYSVSEEGNNLYFFFYTPRDNFMCLQDVPVLFSSN